MFKKILQVSFFFLIHSSFSQVTDLKKLAEHKPSVSFTENNGQVRDQHFNSRPDVAFSGETEGMAFHLKKQGISYQICKPVRSLNSMNLTPLADSSLTELDIYRVDISWPGANPDAVITKKDVLSGHSNFYLDQSGKEILNVKSFGSITYKELYPGIDLHYYSTQGHLKCDYLVSAFTDYKKIILRISGASNISLAKDGALQIKTPRGIIREEAPVVYQAGKKIYAKWRIKNSDVSFEIPDYDPALPMIIDPATRVWATYYGNSAEVFINCTVDALGDVYAVGSAFAASSTIIATSGSYQSTAVALSDGLLVKFNSAGTRLWATYYGGSAGDWIESVVTNSTGEVYIAGTTNSTGNQLASVGAYQSFYAGGFRDCFIAKFNSSGMRQWGTFFGGPGSDERPRCTIDNVGNLYVSGITSSSTNISTPGSHQTIYGGGFSDGFFAKFSPSGGIQWSTYYGDVNRDGAYCCAADQFGNIYFTGFSEDYSTTLGTAGTHQPTNLWPGYDAILVKFNSSGARQWATYFGGNMDQYGYACAVNASGEIYISGTTANLSSSGIATPGCYQASYGGGTTDCFLAKFTPSGSRLWGTYYGSTGTESDAVLCVNQYGYVTLSGSTISGGPGLGTFGSHQPAYGGGYTDLFMTQFDPSGARLWGTYYGGYGDEGYPACAAGLAGELYLCGYSNTSTGTSIATPGSHQPIYGGTSQFTNGFLVQLNACDVNPAALAYTSSTLCEGAQATVTATGYGTINWYNTPTSSGPIASGSVFVTPTLTAGAYLIYADVSTCASSAKTLAAFSVEPNPLVYLTGGAICVGDTFTLNATGASSYTFSAGPVVSPAITTTYSAIGTSSSGCISESPGIATVTVNSLPLVVAYAIPSVACEGAVITLSVNGAQSYSWTTGSTAATFTAIANVLDSYVVSGISSNNCANTATVSAEVKSCTGIIETSTSETLQILPNPGTGIYSVYCTENSVLLVFDLTGKTVMQAQNLIEGTNVIDFGELENGLYVCKITSGLKSYSVRVVKQ